MTHWKDTFVCVQQAYQSSWMILIDWLPVEDMIADVITHWSLNRTVVDMIQCDDSRFSTSQWETSLFCNDVSHWLVASLESALIQCDGIGYDANKNITIKQNGQ